MDGLPDEKCLKYIKVPKMPKVMVRLRRADYNPKLLRVCPSCIDGLRNYDTIRNGIVAHVN
jgi:hypothetical protein